MKKMILIPLLLASCVTLIFCFQLGDGSDVNQVMLFKAGVFGFPLLLTMSALLKILFDQRKMEMGKLLFLLIILSNLMLVPLIIIWSIFADPIIKALG